MLPRLGQLMLLVPLAVCAQTAQTAVLPAPSDVAGSLNRHEFAKALEQATTLHKLVPDDLLIRAYMADAYIGLGDYEQAVAATQELLNMRPGNALGLTRAAQLRELHGDYPGALDFLHKAYDITDPSQRPSLLTKMTHLQLLMNHPQEAETIPSYPAAEPRAANLFDLAVAGAKTFADFEQLALQESTQADNANNQLVAYYLNYAHEPSKALEIAKLEIERRHDILTLDAYACALAATGDYKDADIQIRKALAFASKNPLLLHHAAEIAAHIP